MWLFRITREIFRIKNEYSCEYPGQDNQSWSDEYLWEYLQMEKNIPCQGAIQMNVSKVNYEYSFRIFRNGTNIQMNIQLSNTSRNEDWILKKY